MVYFDNLFDRVLIKPAESGCNKLCVLSGYASVAMVLHHLNELEKRKLNINIELVVGMSANEGISQRDHSGFQQLIDENNPEFFNCRYVIDHVPVHSKVYIWFKDDKPTCCYHGSANYTKTGFFNNQYNTMSSALSEENLDYLNYYKNIYRNSIHCKDQNIYKKVRINIGRTYNNASRTITEIAIPEIEDTLSENIVLENYEYRRLSFLDRKGKLPQRSGLNWGHRPEHNRNQNEAYIKIPAYIGKHSDFFPPTKAKFTVQTDDNKTLICVIAQQGRKALETPYSNSILGQYIRNRLDLPSGARIQLEDLERYGRTHADFYKIDDENYFMDFCEIPKTTGYVQPDLSDWM